MTSISLSSGPVGLRVVPELAGRVLSLTLGGRELLVGPDVNPANFGSTYWTSPQADWSWPPVAAIDHAPFERLEGEPLTLRGPLARVGGAELRLEKRFAPVPDRGIFDLEYTLENVGTTPCRVAGWEVSRVLPGGLTFFPTGEAELTPIAPHGELALERAANGSSYYDHSSFEEGRSVKVHADGRGGYLAHVTAADTAGPRLLFLKLFRDTPPAEQAPGEGEVEIFANEDGRYVEIEVQGAYESIPPGERRTFRVRWVVREIPPSVEVGIGSETLRAFVEGLAGELG